MEELGNIVGQNLIFLRKKFGLTQLEFGEKFNYTDKTVSRWENGSIVPSVEILKQIADFYGVSVDYLITEHKSVDDFKIAVKNDKKSKEKVLFIGIIDSVIWFIAMTIYIASVYNLKSHDPNVNHYWVVFIWCIPLTFVVSLFFVHRWFKSNKGFLILASAFIWTLLAAAFISFMHIGIYWYLFFIGIPVQLAIYFIYRLNK